MARTSKYLSIILLLTAIARAACAEDPVDAAYKRLAKVDIFAFGGIGYAGETSPGEKDFRIIASSPAALSYFQKLYAEGNLQAKCYALVALRKLDPEDYRRLSASIENPKSLVATMDGCLMGNKPFGELVKGIDKGDYERLRDRAWHSAKDTH